MLIEKKILNRWKALKDHGDIRTINKESGISISTLTKAFNGEASEEVFATISEFYNKREDRIKQISKALYENKTK